MVHEGNAVDPGYVPDPVEEIPKQERLTLGFVERGAGERHGQGQELIRPEAGLGAHQLEKALREQAREIGRAHV